MPMIIFKRLTVKEEKQVMGGKNDKPKPQNRNCAEPPPAENFSIGNRCALPHTGELDCYLEPL